MSKIMKYTLSDFNDITFNGFDFKLPEETVKIISELTIEVGSPDYVKTPIFQKRENPMKVAPIESKESNTINSKKKRNNKNIELLNDDDWEAVRNFQTTKIEQKVGIDAQMDVVRSFLNKLTDKNYADTRNKIIEIIDQMMTSENDTELLRIGIVIFEIASTNRFYSKIYAELYSDLIKKYDLMRTIFEDNLNKFMDLFDVIEYVDPSVDYDKFCKINKNNEKRKSLSTFFINLMLNNVITKHQIIEMIKKLLSNIMQYIKEENKKNEVDEITENIAILYKREHFENEKEYSDICVDNMNIDSIISKIANSKPKDYISLTNKTIFKFMDMIEM